MGRFLFGALRFLVILPIGLCPIFFIIMVLGSHAVKDKDVYPKDPIEEWAENVPDGIEAYRGQFVALDCQAWKVVISSPDADEFDIKMRSLSSDEAYGLTVFYLE